MQPVTWKPRRPEVDQYAIKFLIGAGAFALPVIEIALAWHSGQSLASISASYLYDPWPRNVFVGFLFGIGAFMLTYNGDSPTQMGLAKFGAVAAFALALFPCHCTDGKLEIVPHVHLIATIVMFAVLTWFCFIFAGKAREKLRRDRTHREAKWRAYIYFACAAAMVLSIVLLVIFAVVDWRHEHDPAAPAPQGILAGLLLVGECTGLFAFGISWVTASRVVPGLARKDEKNELMVWEKPDKGARHASRSAA